MSLRARSVLAALVVLPAFVTSACGDRSVPDERSGTPVAPRPENALVPSAKRVRIGEAGPAFRACQGTGTARNVDPATSLPVRAAPFDTAALTGRIAGGARFFVCTRSIDERWMGVVFEPGGTLAPGCGVSVPVPRRIGYEGPCASGWVASAAVRLVAA